MRTTLGIEPGAVTPFAAMNDGAGRVTVVLDAAMMAHATINFHPLVNTMTTSIGRDDLVRFLEATGHRPADRGCGGPGTCAGLLTADCNHPRGHHLIGHIEVFGTPNLGYARPPERKMDVPGFGRHG